MKTIWKVTIFLSAIFGPIANAVEKQIESVNASRKSESIAPAAIAEGTTQFVDLLSSKDFETQMRASEALVKTHALVPVERLVWSYDRNQATVIAGSGEGWALQDQLDDNLIRLMRYVLASDPRYSQKAAALEPEEVLVEARKRGASVNPVLSPAIAPNPPRPSPSRDLMNKAKILLRAEPTATVTTSRNDALLSAKLQTGARTSSVVEKSSAEPRSVERTSVTSYTTSERGALHFPVWLIVLISGSVVAGVAFMRLRNKLRR